MVKDERESGDSGLQLRLGVTSYDDGKSPKDTCSQDCLNLPPEVDAHSKRQHFGLKIHPEAETRTGTEPPSGSKLVQGKLGKKPKRAPASSVKGSEQSFRRREVQQSIKEHFMVRRSTRKCKTVLEVI